MNGALRMSWSGAAMLLLAGVYFVVPLIATGIFSFWEGGDHYGLSAYINLIHQRELWESLWTSLHLALETIAVTLVFLIPAVFWMHLKAKAFKPLFDVLSVLPFVVPPIALVAGLTALYTGPSWFVGTANFLVVPYVILALPYTYRALDVGMRSLDLKTLTEASQSLGAGWGTLILRVLVPNLTSALAGAALLTIAIVMGEFTFANVLLFNTFAVYINYIGQTSATEAAALTLLSFVITWLAMLGVLLTGRGQAQLGGAR
ncbi:ABC transporter permease [Acidihalobacter ferrooxydans]|uniref:Spermidine/putrescine ABC transporter permease n=1 Tax=Acidihalobacter ferrooxydans TaxID=1765967 RepID=A0A1P8UHF8_9GAMM|nr:ABC transporter permease subunit [Acidihalobacter ferrooxydans]APZ43288.1 spermidine/putrescine ABC transporter permease [Acidihalobacter ferrooxydans]